MGRLAPGGIALGEFFSWGDVLLGDWPLGRLVPWDINSWAHEFLRAFAPGGIGPWGDRPLGGLAPQEIGSWGDGLLGRLAPGGIRP